VNDTGEWWSCGCNVTCCSVGNTVHITYTSVALSTVPKDIAQWPICSGSVSSIQNKPSRVKGTVSAVYKLPSDLPKLCRQPEKGSPTVPSHLALNSKERGQLQSHLDLVGVDRHRFDYTQEDQGAYLSYLNSLGHSCTHICY
jgi:hypothetical protein